MKYLQKFISLVLASIFSLNLVGCQKSPSHEEEEPAEKPLEERYASEINIDLYEQQLADISPKYNVESIYLTPDVLEEIIYASKTTSKCPNTIVNYFSLYDKIISNSEDKSDLFVSSNPDTPEQIDAIARTCLKNALEIMKENSVLNHEDNCRLMDLTIINEKNAYNSYVYYDETKTTLVIDYEAFQKIYANISPQELQEEIFKEGLTRLFILGLNLARADTCRHRLDYGQINSNTSYYGTLLSLSYTATLTCDYLELNEINEYIFDSFAENKNHNTAVILLQALFKEKRNLNDLFAAIYNSDLTSVYKFFGLEDESDIEEFYKVATTVDYLSENSNYKKSYFTKNTGTDDLSYRNHIGYAYKIDIFKTALRDLIDSIYNNSDLSLEEVIFLYQFVKSIIVNEAYQEVGSITYTFDQDFISNIATIEDIFKNFISTYYNISKEEVDVLLAENPVFELLSVNSTNLGNIDIPKLKSKFPLLEFINTYYKPENTSLKIFSRSLIPKK